MRQHKTFLKLRSKRKTWNRHSSSRSCVELVTGYGGITFPTENMLLENNISPRKVQSIYKELNSNRNIKDSFEKYILHLLFKMHYKDDPRIGTGEESYYHPLLQAQPVNLNLILNCTLHWIPSNKQERFRTRNEKYDWNGTRALTNLSQIWKNYDIR